MSKFKTVQWGVFNFGRFITSFPRKYAAKEWALSWGGSCGEPWEQLQKSGKISLKKVVIVLEEQLI